LEYARIVAEHLGTDHQEIIVGPDKVVRELGDIVWHLDEPVGDPAIMPQYFLAKHTKKKVTVVFNGGGSDEVFAGYRAYKYLLLAEKIRGLAPAFIREGGASILAKASLPSNIKRYVEYVGSPGNEKTYWGQGLLFNGDERNSLYSGSLKEKVGGNNPAESIRKHLHAKKKSRYTLNRFLYVDIKGWLTDNCTMLLDKVMMAHAVECRVPFLDHKLVEYAMTIPPGLKTRGMKKYVLRKAFEGRLPKQIIERPKKGFGVPTDCWFFKDVNDMITERLTSSEFIKENFNTGRIDFLLKKTRDFRHSHQLFGLLTLDLWNERYLRAVG
jgi:asparagine synthase (glutamine-hydrolysing)